MLDILWNWVVLYTLKHHNMDFGISFGAVILLLLPLIFRLFLDLFLIKVIKEEVPHKAHTYITGVVIFITSWAVLMTEPVYYLFQPLLFEVGIFWLFFDYVLNLIRGEKFFYIDLGLDGKQSWFDSWYVKFGWLNVLFLKLMLFAFSFLVYFQLSLILS